MNYQANQSKGKRFLYTLGFIFFSLSIYSCQSSTSNGEGTEGKGTAADTASNTAKLSVTAEKLYDSLSNPWGMAWLPDGRLLVTERAGEILVFRDNKFTGEKLKGVPEVFNQGQGGLMDIKLHPNYSQNQWIYITYSKPVSGGATTAVMRFKLNGNELVEKKDIFMTKPALPADFHFGSRVVFDKDNFLFVSCGERGTMEKVWELNNDHGKIHRLYDDGRVPDDNPFVGKQGANPTIWSYGHRNPQGMVYDADNNRIWAVEHGPKGGDELNLIEKGKNYGWPKTSYGINYDGTILTENKEMEGVTNPVTYWVPSIAPCGMTIVTSDKYPGWKGNLMVGALSFKHIARVQLSGTKYESQEKLLQDIGRVRDVEQGPDGYLYAVTEGPGLLVKVNPQQ
jgi:aldose sugar dehydrogenase